MAVSRSTSRCAGFSIVHISKLIMYEYYYDYLKPKYSARCKLLLTFCCHIETPSVYKDMLQNLDFSTLVTLSKIIYCIRLKSTVY